MDPLQELLLSLPRESAWGIDVCLYQGFWFPPTYLEQLVLIQNTIQVTDTDVILATSPKSGTTWLKALVFAITNRFQHPMDDPNHPLLSTNPHHLVPFLEHYPDPSHTPPPRLLSAHIAYSMLPESIGTTKCRIIYLCRDPKEVFTSLWHFTEDTILLSDGSSKFFVPLEETFAQFCKGVTAFGPIWDQALEYWNMSLKEPEKVLFLRYKDLKRDIVAMVRKMAEFVGLPFSEEEEYRGVIHEIVNMCSFDKLSNVDANKNGVFFTRNFKEGPLQMIHNKDFFRKGEMGDWKHIITPAMREQLDKVTQQKLFGTGLEFD